MQSSKNLFDKTTKMYLSTLLQFPVWVGPPDRYPAQRHLKNNCARTDPFPVERHWTKQTESHGWERACQADMLANLLDFRTRVKSNLMVLGSSSCLIRWYQTPPWRYLASIEQVILTKQPAPSASDLLPYRAASYSLARSFRRQKYRILLPLN